MCNNIAFISVRESELSQQHKVASKFWKVVVVVVVEVVVMVVVVEVEVVVVEVVNLMDSIPLCLIIIHRYKLFRLKQHVFVMFKCCLIFKIL
jgi:hypothetical protein